MTSRDGIDNVTNRRAVGIFLAAPYCHEPLNHLVSEIFSIKFADTQTDTSTEGSLKALPE